MELGAIPVPVGGTGVVEGDLMEWHSVRIAFDGPSSSETAKVNPFLHYRLNVTFTNGEKTYVAPGFYVADGNAAEISKLRSLSDQLAEKTDMAINEAKGFESYQVIWQGEVNYDFDSFELTPTAEDVLNEAGQKMEQSPESIIEIAGHTDRSGTAKYNLMLGEQRAGAAKLYLADRFGISLYRLFIVSYGENKPVATPDEDNASSKNRRVVLKVWGKM